MKKQNLFIIIFFLVIINLSAKPKPDKIVIYKRINDVQLTLHIFNPPNHKPEDTAPAIVFFFGGGWFEGDPSHFYNQSAYLASRGMVAICADYRTETRHGTTPKACVRDGKSAIRWIRGHTSELGIDPDKLAAGGGSAGGHIAAATATVDEFNELGEDISISCRPNALVLFNPVYDNGPNGYGNDRVKAYWLNFSPLHNIHPDMPPTIVFFGTEDQYVPVSTAQKFKNKMEKMGIRSELVLYEGQAHAFFNIIKYKETVTEMDKFLVSLRYIPNIKQLEISDPESE